MIGETETEIGIEKETESEIESEIGTEKTAIGYATKTGIETVTGIVRGDIAIVPRIENEIDPRRENTASEAAKIRRRMTRKM